MRGWRWRQVRRYGLWKSSRANRGRRTVDSRACASWCCVSSERTTSAFRGGAGGRAEAPHRAPYAAARESIGTAAARVRVPLARCRARIAVGRRSSARSRHRRATVAPTSLLAPLARLGVPESPPERHAEHRFPADRHAHARARPPARTQTHYAHVVQPLKRRTHTRERARANTPLSPPPSVTGVVAADVSPPRDHGTRICLAPHTHTHAPPTDATHDFETSTVDKLTTPLYRIYRCSEYRTYCDQTFSPTNTRTIT